MNDTDIKGAMLTALREQNLDEGRRLLQLRHELLDAETKETHALMDRAFTRFWNASPKAGDSSM